MNPKKLHKVYPVDVPDIIINESARVKKGQVQVTFATKESFCFPTLINIAKELGYKPRVDKIVPTCSFVLLGNSIFFHKDSGYDLILGWVVDFEPNELNNFQFFGKKSHIDLSYGDLFVFNSSKGHAWLGNCFCLLALLAVY